MHDQISSMTERHIAGSNHISQPAILLALGDDNQRKHLADLLYEDGYPILLATDGQTALHLARQHSLLLVLLDVHLPDKDGLEMCRLLRSSHETAYIPILMIGLDNDETETIVGLEVGADDYVSSTSGWRMLRARIRALLRRSEYVQSLFVPSLEEKSAGEFSEQESRQVIIAGDLHIDLAGRQVTRKEQRIELSTRLFNLLVYFVRHHGIVLTRLELLEQIRSDSVRSEERLLDIYIHWLREKLEEDPAHPYYLQTVRGIGYRFML